MSRPDPRNVCDGCGQSLDRRLRDHVVLGPIVHKDIWRQLADHDEALCSSCMYERARVRLGRMLRLNDLRPCSWNRSREYADASWFDLFRRLEREMKAKGNR